MAGAAYAAPRPNIDRIAAEGMRFDRCYVANSICAPSRVALRAGKRYKLIRFYGMDVPNGEEWEFYDLEKDPSEMNNAYSNPE